MMRTRHTLLILLLLAVSGCSWFGKSDRVVDRGPKLREVVAELPQLRIPEQTAPAPSREEVLAAYEQVYGSIADMQQNAAVGKRLADLKMAQGEDADIEGAEAPYADAIDMYESLLADESLAADASAKGRDQILYQLARAHDVKGKNEPALGYLNRLVTDHPDSELILEARFRRAEMHFSAGRYREASEDYGFVVQNGEGSPLWRNANYMYGLGPVQTLESRRCTAELLYRGGIRDRWCERCQRADAERKGVAR